MGELQCSGAYRTVPATQPLPVRPSVSHSSRSDPLAWPDLVLSYKGLRGGGFQHLVDALNYGMLLIHICQKAPDFPLTDHTPSKHERNRRIRERYTRGEAVVSPAEAFGISQQRVSQIFARQA
jgi:hypothetical protein